MRKVTFSAARLWVIRSTRTRSDGCVEMRFYETPAVWNLLPAEATLFQSQEAAEAHLAMHRNNDRPLRLWPDGTTQAFDVVTLHIAGMQAPAGVTTRVTGRGARP